MKIPKILKISGKTFTIELRQDRAKKDGVNNAASSSNWSQKIWIDSDQHIESQEEALLHEIIEVIRGESDFDLDHSVISVLSSSLYQVLKDNFLLK